MLVVKVEIWPYGAESQAKELGRLYIANVGGTLGKGKYEVSEQDFRDKPRTTDLIEIPSHTRSRGFWPLVKQALTLFVRKKGL